MNNNNSYMDNLISSPVKVLIILAVIVFTAIFLPAKAFNQEARLNIKVVGLQAIVTAEGNECRLTSNFYDGSYRSSSRTEMVYGQKEITVNIAAIGDYTFILDCPSIVGDGQKIVKTVYTLNQGLVLSAAR